MISKELFSNEAALSRRHLDVTNWTEMSKVQDGASTMAEPPRTNIFFWIPLLLPLGIWFILLLYALRIFKNCGVGHCDLFVNFCSLVSSNLTNHD